MDATEFARRMDSATTPAEVEALTGQLHEEHGPRGAARVIDEALPLITPVED